MKRLLILLLLSTTSSWGATGTIKWAEVQDNGAFARVCVEGMGTNGAFDFKLLTITNITPTATNVYQIPSDQTPHFTLTSPGFDSTGVSNRTSRIVYLTKQLRLPYPQNAVNDAVASSSDTIVRCAMSEYIHYMDSNVVLTVFAGGLYSNNLAGTVTATNLSTAVYGKSIGQWTYPGQRLIRTPVMKSHLNAFHRYGVSCVKFIYRGVTSGVSTTNIQTSTDIDWTIPDIIHFDEYIDSVSLVPYNNHEKVSVDFIVYPRYGDSASVLDTTLREYLWPGNMPCGITNRVDTNNTWSTTIAVVDPAGNDTNGRASTNSDPTAINSSQYFLTLAAAANRCAATNNQFFGHDDCEGMVVYVRSGITNFLGGSSTYGANTMYTWGTFENYPGDTVELTTQTGNSRIGTSCLTRIKGIKLGGSGGFFASEAGIWWDQCTVSNTATAISQTAGSWYVTDCTITNLNQGLSPFGSAKVLSLVRGCNLDGFDGTICSAVMVGNSHPTTNRSSFRIVADKSAAQPMEFGIWYCNYLGGSKYTAANWVDIGGTTNIWNGFFVGNNVFEYCNDDATTGVSLPCNNSFNYTNIIWWNNTTIGSKLFCAYNDAGTSPAYRILWSFKNNVMDDFNIKADVFGTASGNRVGNWPVVWGVGFNGNAFNETVTISGAGSFFWPEFSGFNTLGFNVSSGTNGPGNAGTNILFTSRQSWGGSQAAPTPGGGNYRLLSSAPQITIKGETLLFRDLDGNYRGAFDPPGAYSSGNPRKGGMFIAQ